jgi:hypothetical protein
LFLLRTDDTRITEKGLVATVRVIVSTAHAYGANLDDSLALAGIKSLHRGLARKDLLLIKDNRFDLEEKTCLSPLCETTTLVCVPPVRLR